MKNQSKKPLPKWAKITIIVVCSVVLGVGLFTGLLHLSLYIMSFENDVHRDDMAIESITSIEQYNKENGTAFKHFDNSKNSTAYFYNDKLVFIEEDCVIDGVEVSMVVTVHESTFGIDYIDIFDKEYTPSIKDAPMERYNDNAYVQILDGKTYVQIDENDCTYNLIIETIIDDIWQNIVDQLIGG